MVWIESQEAGSHLRKLADISDHPTAAAKKHREKKNGARARRGGGREAKKGCRSNTCVCHAPPRTFAANVRRMCGECAANFLEFNDVFAHFSFVKTTHGAHWGNCDGLRLYFYACTQWTARTSRMAAASPISDSTSLRVRRASTWSSLVSKRRSRAKRARFKSPDLRASLAIFNQTCVRTHVNDAAGRRPAGRQASS